MEVIGTLPALRKRNKIIPQHDRFQCKKITQHRDKGLQTRLVFQSDVVSGARNPSTWEMETQDQEFKSSSVILDFSCDITGAN